MATQIVLLRGVNVGGANRIAMPVLREALQDAGFTRVRTYLQSGNVLADGDGPAVLAAVREVIDVPCVLRTAAELDAAIAANPFREQAAEDPKHFQVTFRAEPAPEGTRDALVARAVPGEMVAVGDREIYSWHPGGMARSKLALALTPPGAPVTARNWNTVLKLAELAHA